MAYFVSLVYDGIKGLDMVKEGWGGEYGGERKDYCNINSLVWWVWKVNRIKKIGRELGLVLCIAQKKRKELALFTVYLTF
mgnify:CR=1 FL=1